MTSIRITAVLAALLGAVVLAGCGGGDDEVPADAIAVVDSQEIPRSEFDRLMEQAKKTYKGQGREFPKAGTREHNELKTQAVQYLVQKAQLEQKAEDLDIEVTDEEVDKKLKEIKQQFFKGNEKAYRAQLKKQGLTDEQVRKDVYGQLIQDEILAKVTEDVKVTDKEVEEYYAKNKAQYTTPASRDVRHILVAVCAKGAPKTPDCLPDARAKARANDVYAQLSGGGSFPALAKRFSNDTASKASGGKLTIARGQTVKEFDAVAFKLGKGSVSRPVKTQYGYHIIEPLSAVKPRKVTPLAQVKEQIKQQLLQTKKNEVMTKWVEDTKKEFEKKTTYQVGFAPPAPRTTTTARS